MKTTKKWLVATMTALVIALSAMGLASCEMINSLFGESSTQEHVCESICQICEKCTDLECAEDACLSKCLGHGELPDDPNPDDPNPDDPNPDEPVEEIPITGSTRYDFDAIAGYAKIENGKITSKEGVGSWIYDFTWTNNSSATLSVYSDKECESDVVIKVRKTAEVAVLTSKVTVSLNNTVLESEAKIAASSEGADAVFSEVNLGKFWLSEGVNEIKILPMDSTENFDFMSVILYTDADANLRWNDIKDVKGTFFYGVEEAVEITDGFGKNMAENCVGPNGANAYTGGSLITFPIYVSRDAKVNLSLITCTMPVNVVFTDLYGFYINDVQQHSNTYTRHGAAWGDYGVMELGEFELKEGLNKITISSPAGYGYDHHYNFRALIVDTDAKVAFTEVEKEAHICLSVCPDCGGCLDLVCTETACATKCSCAHKCENVCDICGDCTNVNCTEEACLTKCDCTVTTFNAVDDKAIITSGLSKNVDGNFVDVTDLSNLQKVTFTVYSETAQRVNLGFCISNNPTADWTLVDYFRVWINVEENVQDDSNKLSKNDYTAKTIQGDGSIYNNIMIGLVDLQEGENTITLGWTCVGNVAYKFTVRSMLIQSANAVAWGTVVHKCESVCATCNGCMDMTCEEEACVAKCTCGHECENVCGVCGACANVNCTEVICATKCACVVTTFNAVDDKAIITSGLSKNVDGNFVDVTDLSNLQKVTFTVYSESAQTVNLGFCISNNPTADWALVDYFRVWVNVAEDAQDDTNKLSKDTYTAKTIQGDGSIYNDIMIGNIELAAGDNTITLGWTCVGNVAFKFTVRSMLIQSANAVEWGTVVHKCESVCATCNGCMDMTCEEEACATKCTCGHECENVCGVCGACANVNCTEVICATKCACVVTTFNAVDDKAIITSGLSKNVDGNFVDVTDLSNLQKVTFTVYSESAQTVNLGFCISNNPTADWALVDYFRVWVNVAEDAQDDTNKLSKDTYTAKTIQGDGSIYNDIMIGNIELAAGDNTITLGWTCVGNVAFKFTVRSMLIQSANAVAWGTVVHKCESVCATCNGCMDMTCEEEACATKCTCGHECENVCSVCGACTDVGCTEVICATKCGCESATYLAATNAVIEQGKVDNDGNLGCLTLDNNSWRTKFYYVVNAETAGKAELSIVISSTTGGSYAATDVYMTTINGEKYTSDAATVNDGVAWFNYHTIKLGMVELKAGKNVIAFDHYHITDLATAAVTNWGESVNFQSIILKTHVKYTVTHDVCLSKCDFCGGCMDKECAETVCATKCTCALNTFYAVDDKVVITSGLSKNVEGNFVDVTDLSNLQKVTFTIYSESAQTVNLGFCISNNPTASWTLVDYFRVWVNVEEGAQDDTNKLSKTTYTAPTIQGDGSVYNDIMIGNIELKEGNNTITLGWTCVGSVAYKFTVRSMLMHATKPVTLVTAA